MKGFLICPMSKDQKNLFQTALAKWQEATWVEKAQWIGVAAGVLLGTSGLAWLQQQGEEARARIFQGLLDNADTILILAPSAFAVFCVWRWVVWKGQAKKLEVESQERDENLRMLAAKCSELEADNLERMSKIEELERANSDDSVWERTTKEFVIVTPKFGVAVLMLKADLGTHPRLFYCPYCMQKREGGFILQATRTDSSEIMRCPHCSKDYLFSPPDGVLMKLPQSV